MANPGRRRGDGLTYKHGTGSVNDELLTLQLCVESLHPDVVDLAVRVNDLESSRDSIKGMFQVIAVLQTVMILAFIALFSWGLNHMTFHSDWEPPQQHSQSAPHQADLPSQFQPR